jgi:class 3 adenylate cyclase
MSQTRRPAAIFCADVAGYSRLTEQDEAGTARALRELVINLKTAKALVLKSRHHCLLAPTT